MHKSLTGLGAAVRCCKRAANYLKANRMEISVRAWTVVRGSAEFIRVEV